MDASGTNLRKSWVATRVQALSKRGGALTRRMGLARDQLKAVVLVLALVWTCSSVACLQAALIGTSNSGGSQGLAERNETRETLDSSFALDLDNLGYQRLARKLLKGKKHGHGGKKHGGGDNLERRLSYKHGEFSFTRYAREKLYPSSGPFFPQRANLAIMKHIVQSSYQSGTIPLAAVDGDQYSFYEKPHSYASTKSERNPWMHVTLSEQAFGVSSVEIWFPTRMCEQYLKNISLDEKKKWLAALKSNTINKLPWRCQYRRKNLFYQPSKSAPLELAFKVGENVVARKTFEEPASVVTWNAEKEYPELLATSVVVRVKGSAQLSIAEIKVYGTKGTTRCGLASCLHGSCKKSGRCSCTKDWIGPDCSVNIRGNTKYLPNEIDGSWWDEASTKSFERKFRELQGEEYCSRSVAPHLLPGPAGLGAGLGSTMYFRTGDLTLAMKQNRGYNFVGYLNYARNEFCKSEGKYGDFSCYFEENPNCEDFVEQKRSKIKFPALTAKNAKGQDCLLPHEECKVKTNFNDVPPHWAKKDIFWWRTHQISYLFRLNQKVKDSLDLENLKKEINFTHPIIGVHIRSGDGCRHGVRSRLFRCRTLSEYLPDINTLSLKYDTKNVFIATDNPEILDEIKKSEPYSNLTFIVVPSKFREQLKSDIKIEQRMTDVKSTFDSHAAVMSAFQDIHLLAECDYLVTHQASTMSRIALNLATMSRKAVPPFISLDGPWCPQWRMCCEPHHKTGEFLVC